MTSSLSLNVVDPKRGQVAWIRDAFSFFLGIGFLSVSETETMKCFFARLLNYTEDGFWLCRPLVLAELFVGPSTVVTWLGSNLSF